MALSNHQFAHSGMVFQVAGVRGPLHEDLLRCALVWVQSRHPLLQCWIRHPPKAKKYAALRFRRASVWQRQHPNELMRVLPFDVAPDIHWIPFCEDHLSGDPGRHRSYYFGKRGYRWRFFFFPADDQGVCRLLLVADHAIMDALSSSHFMHELLIRCGQLVHQNNLEPALAPRHLRRPLKRPVEYYFPRAPRCEPVTEGSPDLFHFGFDAKHAHTPIHQRTTRTVFFNIEADIMKRVVAHSKQVDLKVNSLLVSALLRAVYSGQDRPLYSPFTTAISLRPFCLRIRNKPALDVEDFGSYAFVAPTQPLVDPGVGPDELARAYEQEFLKAPKTAFGMSKIRRSLLATAMHESVVRVERGKKFLAGPAISNLGVLDFPRDYGPFALQDLFFWTAQPTGQFYVALSVISLHGALYGAFTYTWPLLSEEAVQAIADRFVDNVHDIGS